MEHPPFEDVFPIENGDFPASYVSLPEDISKWSPKTPIWHRNWGDAWVWSNVWPADRVAVDVDVAAVVIGWGPPRCTDWRFCSLSFLLFVVNLVPVVVVVVDDVDVVVFVFVLPRLCSQSVPVYFKGLLDFDFLWCPAQASIGQEVSGHLATSTRRGLLVRE